VKVNSKKGSNALEVVTHANDVQVIKDQEKQLT
jgi:hypothetical protein